MRPAEQRELQARFRSQFGLITRRELRMLGVTAKVEREKVEAGEWERVAPGVIRLAGGPRSPEQDLMIGCLAAGPLAVASHQSATWLWDLAPPPARHALTIPRKSRITLLAIDLHRPVSAPNHVTRRRGIPCTDPLRSLVDLAGVAPAREVDDAVDRALASQLLTVDALEAEVGRLSRQGRCGVGLMRSALHRRGLIGAPAPSVLESRTIRLLRRAGIEPVAVEVWMGVGGRYRIDIALTLALVLEVDGYAFHFSPEQKTEDERRRRRLRLGGVEVLVYTWRDVVYDASQMLAEIQHAILRANQATRRVVGLAP
jgi:very-short-patch-repair endonuclease